MCVVSLSYVCEYVFEYLLNGENDWRHLQGKRSPESELWKCSMWSVTNSGWGDFVDIGDRVWSLTDHWSVNLLWFGCHKLWLRGFWLWWFWFGWQKELLGSVIIYHKFVPWKSAKNPDTSRCLLGMEWRTAAGTNINWTLNYQYNWCPIGTLNQWKRAYCRQGLSLALDAELEDRVSARQGKQVGWLNWNWQCKSENIFFKQNRLKQKILTIPEILPMCPNFLEYVDLS